MASVYGRWLLPMCCLIYVHYFVDLTRADRSLRDGTRLGKYQHVCPEPASTAQVNVHASLALETTDRERDPVVDVG